MNALADKDTLSLPPEELDFLVSLKAENKVLKGRLAAAFETMEKALAHIKFLQIQISELKGRKHAKRTA